MAEKKDRFQGVDRAIDRVREELDDAVGDTKAAGSNASREVREALDNVEERVKRRRERKEE